MSDPNVLDQAALAPYLEANIPGFSGLAAIEKFKSGQSNPTYLLTAASGRYVLRAKPPGQLLKSAHQVDREFTVMSALAGTAVPVPRMLHLSAEDSPIGRMFYVMDYLDGRIFWDPALPEARDNDERAAIYDAMNVTLAAMHDVDVEAVGLGDFGRPGNYFERQIARWTKQLRESPGEPIPELEAVADWLPAHLPADDGHISIAHGDFRLGNLLFHPTKPEVIGILDWELSTLGHPLADLGFCCMTWHSSPDEYGGILGLDLDALGIPGQREFLDHYFAHAVPTGPLERFHLVFSLFRFAVIFVGIADRVRSGSAAAEDAARVAPLAGRFAVRALEVIDGARPW